MGHEWLGYVFPQPINICAIEMTAFGTMTDDIATEMVVESADDVDGEWTMRWRIENPAKLTFLYAINNESINSGIASSESSTSSVTTATSTTTTTTTTTTATVPNTTTAAAVASESFFSLLQGLRDRWA